MMDIEGTQPSMIHEKASLAPIHRLGQNFLKNASMARRIVGTIPSGTKTVIEIGPGPGILTDLISEKGIQLIAYELDARYSSILKDRYKGKSNVDIINRDALDMIDEDLLKDGNYIVSNLPFNISTAIIVRLLDMTRYPFDEGYSFCGATLMFQNEFTDRLLAYPGTKTYGRLSVSFQSKLQGSKIAKVDRGDFFPEPEVDASVIIIEKKEGPHVRISDTALFERIVKSTFSQRRKQLKNTITSIGFDRLHIEHILERTGLLTKRPEELSVLDFITLSNSISSLDNGNR